MTVAEVQACADQMLGALPAEIVSACGDITIHVARDRGDLAELKEAVKESGQERVAIPRNFRAVYLGTPLAEAADDEDDEVDGPTGTIVLNAAMLRDPEDVLYTLLHEMGHALGYDEDEIAALGLE